MMLGVLLSASSATACDGRSTPAFAIARTARAERALRPSLVLQFRWEVLRRFSRRVRSR
jgi:hypothetical protein